MEKISKYHILSILGRGGMGVVYKAHDPVIGRTVAIKVVSENVRDQEDLKQRFYREASSAGNLNHENITVIYDTGEIDGRPYIVMEYLEGTDLKTLIERRTPLGLGTKLSFALQICKGLDFAHENDIVHRDIKPENIRVLANGKIKIMDFGIARPQASDLTQDGHLLGTPAYMSPEQFRGEKVDRRTDIFSLGVLMYELLSFKKPFDAELTTTIIYKIVHGEPEPLELENEPYEAALRGIIDRCLKKDPADRYPCCSELMVDLRTLLSGLVTDPDLQTLPGMEESSGSATPREGTTIHNLLKRGKQLFDSGKYGKAADAFALVLDKSPDHPMAQELLARCRSMSNGLEASLKDDAGVESGVIQRESTVLLTDLVENSRTGWKIALAALAVLALGAGWIWWRGRSQPALQENATEAHPPRAAANPEPQRVFQELRGLAETAQGMAEAGEAGAREAEAPLLAPNAFQAALNEASMAAEAFEEQRFVVARTGFEAASNRFRAAESEARERRASRDVSRPRNEAEAARDGAAKARGGAERAGALTKARDIFDSGLDHQQKGERALSGEDLEMLIEAQKEFNLARADFNRAEQRVRAAAKARDDATRTRSEMMNAKNQILPSNGREQHPKYRQAIGLETSGIAAFRKGVYERASRSFSQAKELFAEVGEDFKLENLENARTAGAAMENAKSAADPAARGYAEAANLEKEARVAMASGDYPLAEQRFGAARTGFTAARAEPVPVTSPPAASNSPIGATPDNPMNTHAEPSPAAALAGALDLLVGRYQETLSQGDSAGLARFLSFSKSEEQGWSAFFESIEQIRARAVADAPRIRGDRAEVRLSVNLSYFNKRNNSKETRAFQVTWSLSNDRGQWRLVGQK